MIRPIDSLNRPKIWMARCPDVRVFEQRVEMFQKGRWWTPLVLFGLTPAAIWLVFDHYDLPQPFAGLFIGLAGVLIVVATGIAFWFRKEGPILVYDREKACLSIPGHRLIIPTSAMEQFHIRDVRCSDGEGGTYITAALALDLESSHVPFCVYVWRRDTLQSVWLRFRAEVEKMMSEQGLPTKAAVAN
ncbi:MAG: hypothetical protein J0L73_19145 [Verrucomicrobia bacterium]|nr:hypothetical protein [Verrucomicrobiota bacterium]